MSAPTKDPGIQIRSDITVHLVQARASDADVVAAARVSTIGEASLHDRDTPPQSHTKLINYLMRDRHGTPFEHNSMTFLISAPIFVFREFQRHRVGWSYNEESARYRQLAPVFYIPAADRNLVQVGSPGHYEFVAGTQEQANLVHATTLKACQQAYTGYQAMLDAGVAREVARGVLPVATYSSMYATCNARSLMAFLSLRTTDPDSRFPSFPQHEIEMVAHGMEQHWRQLMPVTHSAFVAHGRVSP